MATDTSDWLGAPSNKLGFIEGMSTQVQPMAKIHESISLLTTEQLVRQLLLDCRNDMLSDPASPRLEIWFTGGWVRDKLLGIQSSDIDVALSTMTGIQFGEALKDFFSRNRTQYEQEARELGMPPEFKGLHKIARKPDQSKQLETCTAHIFGLDVDFVNLRKDTYPQDSGNSQIEFGTPEEDAFHREATVNALFYNLDTQQTEDLTGKGLQDLAAGILKTPLDPYKTFMDDPLRVLRIIRFASKLGFSIDNETKNSMEDESIHTALTTKITRERFGIEVLKMMNGPHPLRAFQLIYEMGLYSTVFFYPAGQLRQALKNLLPQQSDRPWPATWPHAYRTLAALLEDNSFLGRELAQSEEKGENCWMVAAYAPIAALRRTNLQQVVKIITEATKATNKTSRLLEDALRHLDSIRSTINLVSGSDESPSNSPRSTFGMAIRSWGTTWKLQVLYSLLAEVVYEESDDAIFVKQLGSYSKFLEFVFRQKLQDAPLIKPILNGDDIKRIFELKKGGHFVKTALDVVVRWQFDNIGGSKDEAIEWIRTQKEAFESP